MIRETMRGKGKVALGRVVLAKRERLIMLQRWDKGLLATTLRYLRQHRTSDSARELSSTFALCPTVILTTKWHGVELGAMTRSAVMFL